MRRFPSPVAATAVLLFALSSPFAGTLVAQSPDSLVVNREELRSRLDSLMSHGGPHAQRRAIQNRLRRGDFRQGDALQVRVRGDTALTGAYLVRSDLTVEFGALGRVSLNGLLYSEAQEEIREFLSGYIRNATIEVRPLTRVAVTGQVTDPGFHEVPPTASVADVLTQAGGLTGDAKLRGLKLRRGNTNLLDGRGGKIEDMTSLTLEELGARRGDEFFVPGRGGVGTLGTVLSIVGGITSVAFLITRF